MAPPTAFFAGAGGGAAATSRLAVLLRRNFPTYASPSRVAILRYFSSSTPADPPPDSEPPPKEPPPRRSPVVPINPVSYEAKPAEESPAAGLEDGPETSPRRPPADRGAERKSEAAEEPVQRAWTREEVRYMKAGPAVSPVSYPARVAPLPEDRVEKGEEGEEVEDDAKRNEQLARERRRIEMEARLRTLPKVEEESVPYPTLIKVEKKQQKVVLDLQEAIRGVKVSRLQSVLEIYPCRPL